MVYPSFSDFGNLSPELDGTLSGATAGLLIGFFLGGLPASKKAHEEFILRNKATTFENHFQAKVCLSFLLPFIRNSLMIVFCRVG